MNVVQTTTPGANLSQEVIIINNTVNGSAAGTNISSNTSTGTTGTPSNPTNANIQINVENQASHPGLPSVTIRSALMGAVALEPPPPPIVPRIENLPATATESSTKQLDSFQETYKSLTTSLMQMFDKAKTLVGDLTTAKSAAPGSLSATSSGGGVTAGIKLKSGAGFEWKPRSDRDGKLSVKVPDVYRNAKEVRIVSGDYNSVLATGVNARSGNNPSDIFRFNQVGESYPNGSILQIVAANGKVHELKINDTSHRYNY